MEHATPARERPVTAPPPITVRYCAVSWQPLAGTDERLVALVSLEPHENTQQLVTPATHCILGERRLNQLLGRQRGRAAHGVLQECARYMTQRQAAGLPLEQLSALFSGFTVGKPLVGRGYSVEQLLDAAVRSVSAFGCADEMIDDEERHESPRHTVRTHQFLRDLRRIFVADNKDLVHRFDVRLADQPGAPELVVDYADGPLVVQVTSLPATERQAELSLREGESKLFELDLLRGRMDNNALRPTLMFNTDAMQHAPGAEVLRYAEATRRRLAAFAQTKGIQLLEASTPGVAARLLDRAVAAES